MQFAVSKREVTTSGPYDENTRKIRRTKEKGIIQWDNKLAELELINEEKNVKQKIIVGNEANNKRGW